MRALAILVLLLGGCSLGFDEFVVVDDDAGATDTSVPPIDGDVDGGCGDCGGSDVCNPTTGRCVECVSSGDCTDDTKPACRPSGNTCVECTGDSFCSGETPACNPVDNRCIECTNDTHCTDPMASRCDTDANRCEPCTDASQCEAPLSACVAGDCVECDDDASCSSSVCDFLTNLCADAMPASKQICEPCVSSAECMGGEFCGLEERTGSYRCFRRAVDVCPLRPFQGTLNIESVEGSSVLGCVLELATCDQFLAADRDQTCTLNSDCPDSAFCDIFSGRNNCSLPCNGNEDCLPDETCTASGCTNEDGP